MKKINRFVLGLFIVILVSCATAPGKTVDESKESSVWQISKDANTIYLGGSVHVLPKNKKIPAPFNRAFELSDILVFEADAAELEKNPQAIKSLQSKMFLERACEQNAK